MTAPSSRNGPRAILRARSTTLQSARCYTTSSARSLPPTTPIPMPPSIENLKLTISREAKRCFPHGSIEPAAINIGPFAVEGELVLRYDANTLENLWFANTQQALQISIVNSDVTIGAAAHPGLVFT